MGEKKLSFLDILSTLIVATLLSGGGEGTASGFFYFSYYRVLSNKTEELSKWIKEKS